MSEIELGAPMIRAKVESMPQEIVAGGLSTIIVNVRYRGRKNGFPVAANFNSRHYNNLLQLRPGDEMYVSYDGEDICNIKHNPWWKRLWLNLIW